MILNHHPVLHQSIFFFFPFQTGQSMDTAPPTEGISFPHFSAPNPSEITSQKNHPLIKTGDRDGKKKKKKLKFPTRTHQGISSLDLHKKGGDWVKFLLQKIPFFGGLSWEIAIKSDCKEKILQSRRIYSAEAK